PRQAGLRPVRVVCRSAVVVADGPRDPAADPEEARLPHALRRGPARRAAGPRQSRPAGARSAGPPAADRDRTSAGNRGTVDDRGTRPCPGSAGARVGLGYLVLSAVAG